MEDYAITSCMSSLILLACHNVNITGLPPSHSPPSPCVSPSDMLVRFPLGPLGSLANALDNIRGVTRKRILVTVTGIVRPRLRPSRLHILIVLSFQVNETAVIRLDYGDPTLGTCKETVEGGNHFRYWIQSGSTANRYSFYMRLLRLSTLLISLFPSKAGPFLWPFHTNFQNNVSTFLLVFLSFVPILRELLCAKVGHDVIFNGCALSLLVFFCDTKPISSCEDIT